MTTLTRLATMSGAERFNREVFRLVAPYVGRSVLEVGVGIGSFTERLLETGARVAALDVVPEFVRLARERFAGRPDVEVLEADIGRGLPDAFKGRAFDTVICMNVLEHVQDDAAALRLFHGALSPGGRVVLIVPQYQWLFNSLDSHDGHYRRYSRRQLRERLLAAGFALEREGRFNMTGILGWFVNGHLLRREELPQGQLGAFDRLVPLLFKLESLIGPPLGLSLLMVGRRP